MERDNIDKVYYFSEEDVKMYILSFPFLSFLLFFLYLKPNFRHWYIFSFAHNLNHTTHCLSEAMARRNARAK